MVLKILASHLSTLIPHFWLRSLPVVTDLLQLSLIWVGIANLNRPSCPTLFDSAHYCAMEIYNKTDLSSAFYQIPLAKESMKCCGVATPFRGVRVYTRCAMGMPGSETALEELICRILGDYLQEGFVAKLADNLFCGVYTPDELLQNWERVLESLQKCGICLSLIKTVICPKTITVLGWKWSQGCISASPR